MNTPSTRSPARSAAAATGDRLGRGHPGAVVPAVDLDQHLQARHRTGEGGGRLGGVDTDPQRDPLGQGAQPGAAGRVGPDRDRR